MDPSSRFNCVNLEDESKCNVSFAWKNGSLGKHGGRELSSFKALCQRP